MRYPVIRKGDGSLVKTRVLSAGPCRLSALVGVNNGAAAYIQIHETAAVPAGGSVPAFAFPADAARAYAFALPNPVDLDACTVVVSSTLATYTDPGGTPVTIQGLLAP